MNVRMNDVTKPAEADMPLDEIGSGAVDEDQDIEDVGRTSCDIDGHVQSDCDCSGDERSSHQAGGRACDI